MEKELCPISLEEIQEVYITPCNHKFEKEMIIKYIKDINKFDKEAFCPVCRFNLGLVFQTIPDYILKKYYENVMEELIDTYIDYYNSYLIEYNNENEENDYLLEDLSYKMLKEYFIDYAKNKLNVINCGKSFFMTFAKAYIYEGKIELYFFQQYQRVELIKSIKLTKEEEHILSATIQYNNIIKKHLAKMIMLYDALIEYMQSLMIVWRYDFQKDEFCYKFTLRLDNVFFNS